MSLTPELATQLAGWMFLTGGVLGFTIGRATRSTMEVIKHEDTVIEQGKEIARLRAQVAGIIGKEE